MVIFGCICSGENKNLRMLQIVARDASSVGWIINERWKKLSEAAPSDYYGEVRTGASALHLRAAGIQPHPTSWLDPGGCDLSSGSISPISAVLLRYPEFTDATEGIVLH